MQRMAERRRGRSPAEAYFLTGTHLSPGFSVGGRGLCPGGMTTTLGGETGFLSGFTSTYGPGLGGFSPGFFGVLMFDLVLPRATSARDAKDKTTASRGMPENHRLPDFDCPI